MVTMPRVHAVIAARHRAWQTPPRNEPAYGRTDGLRCHGVGADVGDLWSSRVGKTTVAWQVFCCEMRVGLRDHRIHPTNNLPGPTHTKGHYGRAFLTVAPHRVTNCLTTRSKNRSTRVAEGMSVLRLKQIFDYVGGPFLTGLRPEPSAEVCRSRAIAGVIK